DVFLLKGVPACVTCPKNTGCNPGLFAEAAKIKKGDLCTDPSCYKAKGEEYVKLKLAEAQKAPEPATITPTKAQAPLPAGVKPLGAGYSQSSALAAANAGIVPKKDTPQAPPAPVIEVQKISSTDGW